MTKTVYLGVAAAVLLACAPTMAQETAEAPDAAVTNETAANEVTEPTPAAMSTEAAVTEEADAMAAAGMPGEPMVCKRGKAERHVNVVSPGAEGRVCEVHYAKPTEGVENRVLWYATSDKSFCDERANTLMAKLTTAGWSCANPDGTPVAVETSAPAAETAAETVSAPEESTPASVEADHPAEPEEPADAPEASEAPAAPEEGGQN